MSNFFYIFQLILSAYGLTSLWAGHAWAGMTCTALAFCSFLFFGLDKKSAQYGGKRIPEVVLHLLTCAGGVTGSLLGRRFFNHKTRKASFTLAEWGGLGVLLALA